jgi:hypothetical protein
MNSSNGIHLWDRGAINFLMHGWLDYAVDLDATGRQTSESVVTLPIPSPTTRGNLCDRSFPDGYESAKTPIELFIFASHHVSDSSGQKGILTFRCSAAFRLGCAKTLRLRGRAFSPMTEIKGHGMNNGFSERISFLGDECEGLFSVYRPN